MPGPCNHCVIKLVCGAKKVGHCRVRDIVQQQDASDFIMFRQQ